MARHADKDWNLPIDNGTINNHEWASVHSALLMDIRDELRRIRRVLECRKFQRIPAALKGIRANTERKKP